MQLYHRRAGSKMRRIPKKLKECAHTRDVCYSELEGCRAMHSYLVVAEDDGGGAREPLLAPVSAGLLLRGGALAARRIGVGRGEERGKVSCAHIVDSAVREVEHGINASTCEAKAPHQPEEPW